MADLRIVDAPEIPTEDITGEEKLPTGGSGNYSITLDSVADYTKTKKDLADNTTVDGKVNGVRQELDAHIEDLLNPHQVTKGQIGLGNVDNTADADKPVSNSVQSAIISAVAPKADKTYVDGQLTIKANKADVYTKSETYAKQESSDLVNSSISTALTPVNYSLDLAKRGVANHYDSSLTYNSGERVILANGDIVKSTIDGNANNPNVDMTGWVNPKAVQDGVNQTLQAEVPYSTYPFNTVQEAVDSSLTGNNINLELKQYSESINLNKNNLIGRGYGTVINVANNSYGVKSLQTLPNWDRMRISDIAFKGASRVGTVGFQFDPSDPFAGRRNIEYCTFDNLDIAIHKPKGNIGNTYSNISISNSNYGYKVKSSESPLMHAGNDRFIDAQFNGIDKWAIDLENTSASDGFGQFTVDNSIFQFCGGGGVRLDMGNVVPICPPVIKNTWFEEIAPPNTTIDRDGVNEVPREIKLINCPIVFVEGCYLKNIELINSTMITRGCRIDSAATTYNIIAKDATSKIFADDVYMDGTTSTNVTVRSVAKQKRTTAGGDLTFISTQIRSVTKRPSNALECIGQTFRGGVIGTTTWAVNGSQTVFATCVSDGGEPVAKLPVQVGITNVIGNFGIHAGTWIVWGFSVKPLGQLTGTFKFKNDQDVGNITMVANQWTHNLGIAKVETTGYIAGWIEPTTNGELLIKDYFVAEFTKEEDALNFVNSRMSIDTE